MAAAAVKSASPPRQGLRRNAAAPILLENGNRVAHTSTTTSNDHVRQNHKLIY